jgi:hypothetical protein
MTTDVTIIKRGVVQHLGENFDYSGYDQDFIDLCRNTQQLVQKHQEYGRRTIETGIELGNRLIQIKAGMKYGDYQPYLDMIGLNKATAYYWVRKVDEIAQQEKFNIKLLEAGVIETTLEIIPDEEYPYATNADEALANVERIDFGALLETEEDMDDTNLPTTTEPLNVPTHEHQNGLQSNGHQETHPTEPTLTHRHTGGSNGYYRDKPLTREEIQARIDEHVLRLPKKPDTNGYYIIQHDGTAYGQLHLTKRKFNQLWWFMKSLPEPEVE